MVDRNLTRIRINGFVQLSTGESAGEIIKMLEKDFQDGGSLGVWNTYDAKIKGRHQQLPKMNLIDLTISNCLHMAGGHSNSSRGKQNIFNYHNSIILHPNLGYSGNVRPNSVYHVMLKLTEVEYLPQYKKITNPMSAYLVDKILSLVRFSYGYISTMKFISNRVNFKRQKHCV